MSISTLDYESHGPPSELSDSRLSNAEASWPLKRYKSFTYDTLPSEQQLIRVMVLHGSGVEDAEVTCELRTVDFKKEGGFNHPYEALSWCWGSAKPNGTIIIRKGQNDQKRLQRKVTPDLVAALKALRYQGKDRWLWIDQICVDQDNHSEKNVQVAMMSEIYGRASKVCIWLGEGDRSSHNALEFIKNEVLQLQNFDELCESKQATEKWNDLLVLMQRPWFSRRWVVQEVALAHRTVLYCGRDRISWKTFAVAVELFVEVETASHRLSEVMKKDPNFYHVPGWFEYVSALGASLLVEATGKLFRNYEPYDPTVSPNSSDDESESDSSDSERTSTRSSCSSKARNSTGGVPEDGLHSMKHSQGRPLLTLEYLVSTLSIFEVTKAHDAIYALLAIARDTTPLADGTDSHRQSLSNTQETLESFIQKKRYRVDYKQPFADVCKEFVEFCIGESKDPTRALDIICRPWAPHIDTDKGKYQKTKHKSGRHHKRHRRRKSSTPSSNSHYKRSFSSSDEYAPPPIDPARLHAPQIKVSTPAAAAQKPKSPPVDDLPLPSWIPSLSGAAFAMLPHAGADTLKMSRKNADALVGLPPSSQALERNYNAAETRGVDSKSLRYVKRSTMRHWSMYVKGFVLTRITRCHASSQNGAIPSPWAKAGGWHDVHELDPPNDFWRTLVADRGRDGKNPPVYYSRACKEAFNKGGWATGSVDLSKLIHNERCSVIAQFCRRVQAVIWNRCLIMTGIKRLGLSGENVHREDLICILYGCSVPVVLRRHKKSKEEVLREWKDDLNALSRHITARYRQLLKSRKANQEAKTEMHAKFDLWEQAMQYEYLRDLRMKAAKKVQDFRRLQGNRAQQKRKSPGHSKERNNTDVQQIDLRQDDQDFADTITPEVSEYIVRRATRQDFLAWLAKKREKNQISMDNIKIWDKHVFDLQLKWGRRLKTIWKAKKGKIANKTPETYHQTGAITDDANETPKAANKTLEMSGQTEAVTDDTNETPKVANETLETSGQTQAATDSDNKIPNAINETPGQTKALANGVHPGEDTASNDGFLQRHRKWYLGPYKTDKDTDELEEPDWTRTDAEGLLMQQKWSHYEFLGECYVHGMMDGEAMDYQNAKDISAQVFELR